MSLFVLSVTLFTACLPFIVKLFNKPSPYSWLPVLAGVLFFAAFFIPDIHISKETTTFQQHFVGGGIYCALLFIYFQKVMGWKANLLVSILLLFAWASAFGVTNELFEFTLTKLQVVQIDTGDTGWDLLANTSGALTGYITSIVMMRLAVKYFSHL